MGRDYKRNEPDRFPTRYEVGTKNLLPKAIGMLSRKYAFRNGKRQDRASFALTGDIAFGAPTHDFGAWTRARWQFSSTSP